MFPAGIPNHVAMSHLSLHLHMKMQPSPASFTPVGGSPDVPGWMRTTPATGVADARQSSAQLQRHPAPLTGRFEARFATPQISSPLRYHPTLHSRTTGNIAHIIRQHSASIRGSDPSPIATRDPILQYSSRSCPWRLLERYWKVRRRTTMLPRL